MTGVIGHLPNPTVADAVELATTAEAAGATWIGLADAFWWRDVWMLLAAVADATAAIEIGPAMTNPYLRHPFHTVSALATLAELAPGRVFAGIAAGGSEVTAAAGIPRHDAPARVAELIATIRACTDGAPLDAASGRHLDVALDEVPILVAGRGDEMLALAGALADRVLLWAIPDSDLDRSVHVVLDGAAGRRHLPELIWAPLVAHDPELRPAILHVAVYASLNTRPKIRTGWGLDAARVERIRTELVGGGTSAATALVPEAALADLVVADPDPAAVADRARRLGIGSIAVPGFGADRIADHVRWASAVEALL